MYIVYDMDYDLVSDSSERKGLEEGDIIKMEVDLRSDDADKRYLYFYVNNKWKEDFFCGVPESVKFAVYFFLFFL